VKWLEAIHRRTGRPIWVTEFNNGADWVKNHNPSLKENAVAMDGFIRALDAAPFVERYSVFNLGNAKFNRQVIRDGKLTPAGVRYRDHRSAEAYRGKLRSSRVP
ncbi:MAG: glycoside hydrolase family protein, partial [Desulfobacterales bacterium]|nr:glycoside hydrolase family protein [Desulfobacterales bacterium]